MTYAIVGLGRSGESARRLLQNSGVPTSQIVTFDDRSAQADFRDSAALLATGNIQTLVVSPGVPLATPWIQDAVRRGMRLESEISLAIPFLKDEKLIGVTGSLGKSTTVALLYQGALAADPDAFLGGNFGTPLADYVSDVLEGKRPRAKWLILELSSYQLENPGSMKLDFGAITYFAPNHLERYPSLRSYYDVKWSLSKYSRGPLLLNQRGGELIAYARQQSQAWTAVDREDENLKIFDLGKNALIGDHQTDNLALAARIAIEAGWPAKAIDRMKLFPGLSHRLENRGSQHGVQFVNDSKGTAIESVYTAIQSCLTTLAEPGTVICLLGGKDKGLPWDRLSPFASHPRLKFLFFGSCAVDAKKKSALSGETFPSLGSAIDEALKMSKDGDLILLSPGGTSLDEFKNFEERGNFFNERVLQNAALIGRGN